MTLVADATRPHGPGDPGRRRRSGPPSTTTWPILLALLASLPWACSKGGSRAAAKEEAGPGLGDDAVGRMIGRLQDPAMRERGLQELEGLLAQVGSSQDPGIRRDSLRSVAGRADPTLVEAFGDPATTAAARPRIVAALGTLAPHDDDDARRAAVLDGVFLPTLGERFEAGGSASEAHLALLGALALTSAPGIPPASGATIVRVVAALRTAVGVQLGASAAPAPSPASLPSTVPTVSGEELLLACLHAAEELLGLPEGKAGEAAGVEIVMAPLRDVSTTVPVAVRLAAAEAAGRLAGGLDEASVRTAADALVTGLFAPVGPGPEGNELRVTIRRALVTLGAAGGVRRDAIVRELLRVLALAADPPLLARIEAWQALGKNADVGRVAAPDRILRRATAALADVLPRDGKPAAPESPTAVALEVLRSEIVLAAGAVARGGDALDGDAGSVTIAWALAAAETLATADAAGPDDQNVDLLASLVRATATNLETLPGPPPAFAEAATGGRATFAALLESLVRFGRPTPQVLSVLADLTARPNLAGVREDAVFPPSRAAGVDGDAAFVRGRAARAFLALYRRGPAGAAEADPRADGLRFRLERVEPLLALEQTDPDQAPFRLWPPPFTAEEEPAPSAIDFADFADALAACALPPQENAGHVAAWRAMSESDRERYCRAWVEPFALEPAPVFEGFVPGRMQLADERCWGVMRRAYQREAKFCSTSEAQREATEQPVLSGAQCVQVLGREGGLGACFNLPRHPERAERGQPSLWWCYERFPWLREREPVGPSCPGLAARLLAARLFVRLRDHAGTPSADDATPDRLEATLPFAEFLERLALPAAASDAVFVAALERMTAVLAEVQLDVPEFRPPRSPLERIVGAAPAPTPEASSGEEELIPVPWYARPGFVERRPTTFAPLLAEFRAACGAPAGVPEAPCARGGGKLGEELSLPTDPVKGGSLAAVLIEEGLPARLAELAAADLVDARCFAEGVYDAECLGEVVGSGEAPSAERERALRLLWTTGAQDAGSLRAVLLALAAAPADPLLEPLLGFALRRAGIDCPPCPGSPGCEANRCESLRFGD